MDFDNYARKNLSIGQNLIDEREFTTFDVHLEQDSFAVQTLDGRGECSVSWTYVFYVVCGLV